MTGLETPQRRREGYKGDESSDNKYGIDARPLPVAATEVQPHAELVEGERHRDAIDKRRSPQCPIRGTTKENVPGDGREQEDPVVEVMDVRAAKEEVKVRDSPRHDQNDHRPRADEGEKEGEESAASETV